MAKNCYPVYVISKGRYENCLTAKYFIEDKVDFKLVVEKQEADEYKKRYGENKVVILPFSNKGLGSYPARNWCWEDSIKNGYKRHWIFDDNIRGIFRLFKGVRIRANTNNALRFVEDITDNYTNVAISGMNYSMFAGKWTTNSFVKNHHIYSNLLILNEIPYRWRLRYNEDTDLNLQVLKGPEKYCLLYTNIFLINKMRTMVMKGGNTEELYKGEGRLKMAKMLEKVHPDVVTTKWRFGRPQHVVNWNKFKQPLIKVAKPKKIDLNNYGKLVMINEVKSLSLRKLIDNSEQTVRGK